MNEPLLALLIGLALGWIGRGIYSVVRDRGAEGTMKVWELFV